MPFSGEVVMLTPVATALFEFGSSLRKRKPLVLRLIQVRGTSRERLWSWTRFHVEAEAEPARTIASAITAKSPARRTAGSYRSVPSLVRLDAEVIRVGQFSNVP
jgi:hypothetical protein